MIDVVPAFADERWRDALSAVVSQPERLSLFAQPIVELASGRIAGYEVLSRFAGPWNAAPDVWFAAAQQWGCNALLQSRVLVAGIALRRHLPSDTFLTVNVDPHLLTTPEVSGVLVGVTDLSRVVLELTEHTQAMDDDAAAVLLHRVRAVGGLLAMDDAGTGYAGLSKLLAMRPDMVKLDREFITGIDQDPVKRALMEVFGDLAGRMDAWILAEGIETRSELDTVIGLGVPLGQGFALARPAATMAVELEPDIARHIRSTAARTSLHEYVASILRPVSVGRRSGGDDVRLAADGRPHLVRYGATTAGDWCPAMTVAPTTTLPDAARRAMSRVDRHRFAPLVCTDGRGMALGLVRIDDLLIALARTGSNVPSSSRDQPISAPALI